MYMLKVNGISGHLEVSVCMKKTSTVQSFSYSRTKIQKNAEFKNQVKQIYANMSVWLNILKSQKC